MTPARPRSSAVSLMPVCGHDPAVRLVDTPRGVPALTGMRYMSLAAVLCAVINPCRAFSVEPGGRDVLAVIGERAELMYRKYSGIESKRDTVSTVSNSKTGEILNTYRILVVRKDYFRKRPEYVALRYIKDGKDLPPEEYNYRTREPVYQPFGNDSNAHYSVKLKGIVTFEGRRCYEIDIEPKKRSSRHIRGKAWCDAASLDLFCLEGTVSKLPFGVTKVYMKIYFRSLDDGTVMTRGDSVFEVNIPILYPHRRFVSSFICSEQRLIPLRE